MSDQVVAGRFQLRQQLKKREGQRTLLAYDQWTQEFVILKFRLFVPDLPEETLARLERDSEILKTLYHPSIPAYLDYFTIDLPPARAFVIVQEQAEGKSLREHLATGRLFTELQARQIARAILDILAYLHGLPTPVIHRNIKPSNILVGDWAEEIACPAGVFQQMSPLYLIDFGALQAPIMPEDTSSTIMNSYDYMPPEQFAGRAVMASDLYALGITLIDLVTQVRISELPRKGQRILFEQVVTTLSPGFTDWLKRMTEPDLPFRFPNVQIALNTLEKLP
ncbi:hypothetical protein BST81_00390 [Leptolyngbya sp. 'hensonii']|uniref:serine/threonine protein kinase n=1 Tax=Leptolyngbya sp. 'hensonii' TaxID=1922337 RepID=UPI00095009F9|nr:protein kinase [Leptolyngbya sp. 'hensonii']OLP20237.1 hypothetical protein BST81_00390 [Leptolyngbya sp. 'hensonii']